MEQATSSVGFVSKARTTVAQALRAGTVRGKARDYPFSEYLRFEFVRNGRLLMSLVDEKQHEVLAALWATPNLCAHYTAFSRSAFEELGGTAGKCLKSTREFVA
jgi:hypothetical protein